MIKSDAPTAKSKLPSEQNNVLGIGLMMLGMLLMACMDTTVKWLVEADVSPIQVLAMRSWIIIPIILIALIARKQLQLLKTARPLAHGLRGGIGLFAPLPFFIALKYLPLADATVVFFSSSFILTAISAILLKERVGIHRWTAVFHATRALYHEDEQVEQAIADSNTPGARRRQPLPLACHCTPGSCRNQRPMPASPVWPWSRTFLLLSF